jgi:hypothetical protein
MKEIEIEAKTPSDGIQQTSLGGAIQTRNLSKAEKNDQPLIGRVGSHGSGHSFGKQMDFNIEIKYKNHAPNLPKGKTLSGVPAENVRQVSNLRKYTSQNELSETKPQVSTSFGINSPHINSSVVMTVICN